MPFIHIIPDLREQNADIPFSIMNTRKTCQPQPGLGTLSSKSGWALRTEDLLVAYLGDTVRERERKFLGDELLDIGALDVLRLLKLDNAENLQKGVNTQLVTNGSRRVALRGST